MKLCRIENLKFLLSTSYYKIVLQEIDIATSNNGLEHKATWVTVRPVSSIDFWHENSSPKNGVIRPHFQSVSVSTIKKCAEMSYFDLDLKNNTIVLWTGNLISWTVKWFLNCSQSS